MVVGGGDQEDLLPTCAIHPWPPVPSSLWSVGTWASGTYPVIRATQQAGRGLREGPVEAAAACPAQGAKAGRLGCGVHCLASPPLSGEHRLSSSRHRALGRSSVLLPPRRHALACTSSPGPPATMVLSALPATAAAGLQGALLGHLGRPCRGRQGLEASPWGCPGLSPPGRDRLRRGQRKGGPLGRW